MMARVSLSQSHEIGATTVPARKFLIFGADYPEGAEISVELDGDDAFHSSVQEEVVFFIDTPGV